MLYLNDSYGTGLNTVFQETFTGAGGTIVAEQSYNTGDTSFDAQISAITASNPDAIVLITFDEIYTIGPALLAAGYPASQLYLVDGNLKNFGSDEKWPAGSSMEGAKGTTPAGPLEADSGFQDPPQRVVGRRGQHRSDRLLVRERVLRRRHPARARRSHGELDRVGGHRREPPAGLGRGRQVRHVRGMRRHHPRWRNG